MSGVVVRRYNTNRFLHLRVEALALVFRLGCAGAGWLPDGGRSSSSAGRMSFVFMAVLLSVLIHGTDGSAGGCRQAIRALDVRSVRRQDLRITDRFADAPVCGAGRFVPGEKLVR